MVAERSANGALSEVRGCRKKFNLIGLLTRWHAGRSRRHVADCCGNRPQDHCESCATGRRPADWRSCRRRSSGGPSGNPSRTRAAASDPGSAGSASGTSAGSRAFLASAQRREPLGGTGVQRRTCRSGRSPSPVGGLAQPHRVAAPTASAADRRSPRSAARSGALRLIEPRSSAAHEIGSRLLLHPQILARWRSRDDLAATDSARPATGLRVLMQIRCQRTLPCKRVEG